MSAQDLIIFFWIAMLECIGHLRNFAVTSNPWIAQHYQFYHCLLVYCPMSSTWTKFITNGTVNINKYWIYLFQSFFVVVVLELFVIVKFITIVSFEFNQFLSERRRISVLSIRSKKSSSANVVMSTAIVPRRVGSPFPQKKKTMKLFYHLLSDMKHQRVAVIALALGQAVNIHSLFLSFFLFAAFVCHQETKKKITKLVFIDFSRNQRISHVLGIGACCIVFGVSWFDSCKTNITIIDSRPFGSERAWRILWNTEDTRCVHQWHSLHGSR